MKEHPLLFCGDMVRAVQAGRKTQTRRCFQEQPPEGWQPLIRGWYTSTKIDRHGEECPGERIFGATDEEWGLACPYGAPGDRLWVRETWSPWADKATEAAVAQKGEKCVYRADYQEGAGAGILGGDGRWHPSIHMPRWASRILLEVTDVRVERVQEISEEDAKAEGVRWDGTYWLGGVHPVKGTLKCWPTARRAFQALWDSINDKRGFGWDVNPWVWVVGFKMLGAGK